MIIKQTEVKQSSNSLELRLLPLEDFQAVIAWNKAEDRDFLYQWSGRGYTYPLTLEQYEQKLINGTNQMGASNLVFGIYEKQKNKIIGSIELSGIDHERKLATVCRFLIGDPISRGRGYGQEALALMVKLAREEFKLKMIFLKVFDFNIGGIRCYEKSGFRKIKFEDDVYRTDNESWGRYTMVHCED